MARVKYGKVTRKRHKKVMRSTKGAFLGRSKLYKQALVTMWRSMSYATKHRRLKKRDFRRLWITRIGAAAGALGTTYSKFINGLKVAQVALDRKMLAELVVSDEKAFKELVKISKEKKKK